MDHVQLFDDLVRVETEVWNLCDERLREEARVTIGRVQVLRVIDRVEHCRVQDVADGLTITVGGASQAVDRAVADGQCFRRAHPDDRRSSIVELTGEGERVLALGLDVLEADLRRLLADVDTSALSSLAATLSTLRQTLRNPTPGPDPAP